MPMCLRTRCALYSLLVAAWLVVIADAIPATTQVFDDSQRALAVLVAAIGTLQVSLRRILAPAHELFAAGVRVGHARALAERDTDVVRLDERRALRVVTDETTVGQL